MLKDRLRLLLFALAFLVASTVSEAERSSQTHEEYKEKLAEWEADGGWEHDKYQR